MSRLATFALVLLCVGCERSASDYESQKLEEPQTPQAYWKIEKLFDHEGCEVFRFYDGRARYFVKCKGAVQARTEFDDVVRRSNGKTSSTHYYGQTVPTESVP